MLPEVVALALAAQLLRRSPAGEVPAWGQLWHRPAALDLADFRHSMGCGERAGFSWVYQSGGSGIALLVFGLAAVALTAALHLGAAILYVPKVGLPTTCCCGQLQCFCFQQRISRRRSNNPPGATPPVFEAFFAASSGAGLCSADGIEGRESLCARLLRKPCRRQCWTQLQASQQQCQGAPRALAGREGHVHPWRRTLRWWAARGCLRPPRSSTSF